jgi:rhodanese-related sulfurtransferase
MRSLARSSKSLLLRATFFNLALLPILFFPGHAQAIPPPDFIFNFFSQIPQMLATGAIVVAAGFGLCYQFLRTAFDSLSRQEKVLFAVLSVIGIGLVVVSATYYYDREEHQAEFEKWRAQELRETEEKFRIEQAESTRLANAIGAERTMPVPEDPDASDVAPEISTTEFGELVEPMIELEGDDEIATVDASHFTSSFSEAVKKGRRAKGKIFRDDGALSVVAKPTKFYLENRELPLVISNTEFKMATEGPSAGFFVVDARESIEWGIGHHPLARHIRYADLRSGEAERLPKDRFVYVFCATALRGSEVAEFLRRQGVLARYVEAGAIGWEKFGGAWQGDTKLRSAYHEPQHQKILKTDEVKSLIQAGARFVDMRSPEKFLAGHIEGSVNVSVLHTPTSKLEAMFSQVPEKSRVILIVDDHWSSFDGFITGIELERRGHTYLGRYDKYDEFR